MLNKSTFRLVIILFEFFISALSNIFYIFFAFSLVIFIHEFGHYYVGKRCGIGVQEFSIGFGPKLLGFKINLVLFGKFVYFLLVDLLNLKEIWILVHYLLKIIIIQKVVIILIMHQ